MTALQTLYDLAQEENIVIDRIRLTKREALSIMDPEGDCFIAMDPSRIRSAAEEKSKLSHELGHCLTGSFYNRFAPCDLRQKHENRADKWAIESLVPVQELDDAIAAGCTQLWELADHFGVTEDFIKKAVCYHVHGNLATELYF